MRIYKRKVNSTEPILLGRQNENEAEKIIFDVSEWEREYGDGNTDIVCRRNGDESPYPIIAEKNGNEIIWKVSAIDTNKAGDGECELRYTVGDTVVKSTVYRTVVIPSVTGEGEAPEPWEDWLTQLLEAGDEVKVYAEETEENAESARQSAEEAKESKNAAIDGAEEVQTFVRRIPNEPFVRSSSIAVTSTAGTITESRKNIRTGDASTRDVPLPIANDESVGLMTPEQVQSLAELISDVGALKGQTVRLLYTAKTNPTSSDIEDFVYTVQGYTDFDKWPSIAVVVSETFHIWHCYKRWIRQLQEYEYYWEDDGLDTVVQATQSLLGIVKGATANGKVFVETDGTMSLNGYDALITALAAKLNSANITHEPWTFTLADNTTVTKDVALWLS